MSTPLALGVGETTSAQFAPNFDALYLIEIQAGNSRSSDEESRCFLRTETDSSRCRSTLVANWVLSSSGRELRRGSSADPRAIADPFQSGSRVLGEFQGNAGHDYSLQVSFTSDATALAVMRPRLKVMVASIAYTDIQSASVLVFSIAFICVLFGGILLGLGFYSRSWGLRDTGHKLR